MHKSLEAGVPNTQQLLKGKLTSNRKAFSTRLTALPVYIMQLIGGEILQSY